jgi:hypothetical protein
MLERLLICGDLVHLHSFSCTFTLVKIFYYTISKRRRTVNQTGQDDSLSLAQKSSPRMATTGKPTVYKDAELRNHLRETLEDLPNNLPQYNQTQLLGTISTLEHFKVHADN